MARVARIVDGDAVAQSFDKGLCSIVPASSDFGALDSRDEQVAQIIFAEETLLVVGKCPGGGSALGVGLAIVGAIAIGAHRRYRLVVAVEHQACNLFARELGGKIGNTYVETETPVLVLVELAVAVQILEGMIAFLQNLYARSRRVAQRGTILANQCISVMLFFDGLLCAGSHQKDHTGTH